MVILDQRSWPARALDAMDSVEGADPVGGALRPLGALYAGLGAAWRRLRPPRPLAPVPWSVGIGNLRVGGTGKTPVVGDLARRWRERGRKVAVLTRGYGGADGGDEPDWLRDEARVRIVVDADRRRGQRSVGASAEIVLLDDALQARAQPARMLVILLDRDLRRMPHPLPAGPAREGAGALRRADALLVRVETDPWPVTEAQRDGYRRFAARHCGGRAFAFRLQPTELLDAKGEVVERRGVCARPGGVVLVSGLARPRSFERDSVRFGLPCRASLRLDDHARPGETDARRLRELRRAVGATTIVCPEKNLARLAALDLGAPLLALRSRVRWAGPDPLDALDALYQSEGLRAARDA